MAQQVEQAAVRDRLARLAHRYVVLTRSIEGHAAGTVGYVVEAPGCGDHVGVEVDRASDWPQTIYADCTDLRILG